VKFCTVKERVNKLVRCLGYALSPPREEGGRDIKKMREATAYGADGVVARKSLYGVSDHPRLRR
jgi:hypothetical protein